MSKFLSFRFFTMIRLQDKYKKEVIPRMVEKFGYKNVMAVPKIEKVVLNIGIGRLLQDRSQKEKEKIYQPILDCVAQIAGQKPILTTAKKSIAGFKIREGLPVGVKVTLRGKRMEDFLERLVHVALPRSRDFEGIDPKSFDKTGNLTIGIKEHIVFPEISAEREEKIFSFEITITTTAKTREEGTELLRSLGFPIRS